MREFLYHTTIELINPYGEVYILDNYRASISEGVEARVKTINVETKILDDRMMEDFTVGTEINVYSSPRDQEKEHIGTFLIHDNPRAKEGIQRTFQFNGTCYLGKTQYQVVSESYQEWYIHEIVAHLIRNYAPWLSVGFIQPTEHKMSIAFNDRYLYDCLNEIAETYNGMFEVDKDKRFFFQHKQSKKANKPITNEDFKKGTADFSLSMDKFANRLSLYGGDALSEKNYTDYIQGDGKNNVYGLRYKPRQALSGKVEIEKNGLPIRVGAAFLHQFEDGFDVLINASEKNVEFETPLEATDEIAVTYRYEYPLKTIMENTNSIQEYGLYEQRLEFKDITEQITLRERGQQHLEKYGLAPLFVGSLEPFFDDWACGENVFVDIPELGVNHELQVTSKNISLSPNEMNISLEFEQKVKTREILKDILLRLESLKEDAETTRVEKYEALFDTINVSERIRLKNEGLFIVETTLLQ